MISIAASVQGRSTADRLSDSTAPVRRVPTINPKRRRSSAQDDRREPPHLNENRRINGPDRRSDVPSSPPPTQNAARERESLFAKIFKSLLQQNRPETDSLHSITLSGACVQGQGPQRPILPEIARRSSLARSRFFSLVMVTQNTRNNLTWIKFAVALCDRLNARFGP